MATSKSPKQPTPKQEAANENTSQARLRELAGVSTELARIVAKNPSADPDLLRELGSSADESTRKAVTANPNTPSDVLLKLGAQFPGQLLDNLVFGLLILENPNLLADMPTATLRSLLKRDVVPEGFLEWAAGSSDEGVLLAVAMNLTTPKSALEKLIQSWNTEVAEAAKLHVNWAGEMSEGWDEVALAAMKSTNLKKNSKDEAKLWEVGAISEVLLPVLHTNVLSAVAQNPETPEHILKVLGEMCDPYYNISRALAQNPQCPPSFLEPLVGSNDRAVRELAAENPNTPFALLQQFQMQIGIVEHPHTDSDTLRELAMSQWEHIRLGVAGHLNTPQDVLEQLATDQDFTVCMAVALSKNTPTTTLEKLVTEAIACHPYASVEEVLVLLIAACHPHASAEVLEQLAAVSLAAICQDDYYRIREAVALNPNTPTSLLEELAKDPADNVSMGLAQNPNTPVSILEQLTKYPDLQVQRCAESTLQLVSEFLKNRSADCTGVTPNSLKSLVSKFPHRLEIPENMRLAFFCLEEPPITDNPDLLGQIAKISNSNNFRLVAMNPATPINTLRHLALNDEQWIQRAAIKTLTQNANTPGEILQQLVEKADLKIGVAIALHPNTPVAALEELANATDWQVHLVVAKNPNTPVTALEKLAQEDNWKVRQVVAQNSKTPESVLKKLLQDQDKYVRAAAIANPNTPKNLLEQIERLNSPETPQDRLAELATSEWLIIRERVALHPNTPVSLLEELAKDQISAVRLAVAQNPNTPGSILEQLVEDKDKEVAIAIAANPNTPVSILEELAQKTRNKELQEAAIKNIFSRYPDKAVALETFLKSFKPSFTRLLVFLNPLAPSSFLAKNFRSSSWLERYAIAQNPNTPLNTLKFLLQDGNRIVRAAARANLQQRNPV